MNHQEGAERFGIDDLYAAYLLQKTANEKYKFGREGIPSRRFTRFLFYMIVIELLKAVMIEAHIEKINANITQAFLKLFNSDSELASNSLFDTAIQVIDEYMTEGNEESVYKEPECQSKDVKGYMRWEQLGKTKESSPKLLDLLAIHKRTMKRITGGQESPFNLVLEAIR